MSAVVGPTAIAVKENSAARVQKHVVGIGAAKTNFLVANMKAQQNVAMKQPRAAARDMDA